MGQAFKYWESWKLQVLKVKSWKYGLKEPWNSQIERWEKEYDILKKFMMVVNKSRFLGWEGLVLVEIILGFLKNIMQGSRGGEWKWPIFGVYVYCNGSST